MELAHLGLVVKDCETSRDFYCQTLGCTWENSWQTPDIQAMELRCGNIIIELLEYPRLHEQRFNGVYDHLAFIVKDIEACIQELNIRGVAFETATPRQLLNGKKIIFFHGPDGERIELIQEP